MSAATTIEGHCQARLFEWMTSLAMIGISVIVAVSPDSIPRGGFHYMREMGFSATGIGVFCMAFGMARLGGLIANGASYVYGPRLRAAGALAGAFIWMQMLYSLVLWSTKSGYLSIGVAIYAVLALGDFISCWRAATDVRHS